MAVFFSNLYQYKTRSLASIAMADIAANDVKMGWWKICSALYDERV